jgi:S-adenosyl methyltransferase
VRAGWRPESGVKVTGAVPFMVVLGDSADILGGINGLAGGDGAWPELAGRVKHGAVQVLQQAQAAAGHGQAASAAGGPVQDGPATRYLAAEAAVRQFLDIGTGIPAAGNTHEVAQRVAPDARVVYVDNDPIVLLHTQALLRSTPEGRPLSAGRPARSRSDPGPGGIPAGLR